METLSLLWGGFCFGLMLQLAIGPVFLLVVHTSVMVGWVQTFPLIAAVALADAIYIALSSFGASAVLLRPQVQRYARIVGAVVLGVFGVNLLLSAFGMNVLPNVRLFQVGAEDGLFKQGLLLTLSNPLTLIFWGATLSGKVAREGWDTLGLILFGCGCVLSTLLFLTAVAGLGSLLRADFDPSWVAPLNGFVGASLIYFGLRMAFGKLMQASDLPE